jgi:hypothetical protein
MIQRCTNPSRNNYRLYGGRGITVCDSWQSFEAFLADMGPRPQGHSIGRVNVNEGYCSANCEWQTDATQARSRRNNKLSESTAAAIRASVASTAELSRQHGVSKTMIRNVLQGRAWA